MPALIIDQLLEEEDRGGDEGDAFRHVAWGGGPGHLLSAITSRQLYIFSVRNFMLGLEPRAGGGGGGGSHVVTPSLPSGSYHLVSRSRLPHPVLAVDWTHAGCGLLLTDEAHRVVMTRVTVSGLDSQHVARGGYPEFETEEAWSVCSDTPHVLAAAGLDAERPCATAPLSDAKASSQHRVTIWWPQTPAPKPTEVLGAKKQDKPVSALPSVNQPASHVGAEVIRHPVKVLSIQWSPALASAPPPTLPPADAHPPPPPHGKKQQPTASTAAHEPHAADPAGPSLALMTVGADWAVRIFVEVVMRDLFPRGGTAAGPGLSMSQYCLTLVIEAPVPGGVAPGAHPGLRACWAQPLHHERAAGSPRAARGGPAAGMPLGGSEDGDEDLLSSKVRWSPPPFI